METIYKTCLVLLVCCVGHNVFAQNNYSNDIKLNNFIQNWIGVKYKLGGKTKNGIDCSQFNKRLYQDVYNIELGNVCYEQWKNSKRIVREELITGDLVFFRSKASPTGWHCGTYIGDNKFVHSSNKKEGVKISNLNEPIYYKGFRGGGRVD